MNQVVYYLFNEHKDFFFFTQTVNEKHFKIEQNTENSFEMNRILDFNINNSDFF